MRDVLVFVPEHRVFVPVKKDVTGILINESLSLFAADSEFRYVDVVDFKTFG